MKPTPGRIVHYRLAQSDADAINRRRVPGAGHSDNWPGGAQAHVGNRVSAGTVVPVIVTTVWPNEHGENFDGINGQAILDGNDSYWITSAKEGTEMGQWCWPERRE